MDWKLQSGQDEYNYVRLVIYNAGKTPEERNKHFSGLLLMKKETEAGRALPGETPSGDTERMETA